MPSTTINGIDVRSLGLHVESRPRFRSMPARSILTQPVLGSLGTIGTGFGVGQPGELTMVGTALKDTYAQRAALEDTIKDLSASGSVAVVCDDGVSVRRAEGVAARCEIEPFAPGWKSRAARVTIGITCPDPTWRSVEPTLRHLAAASTRYDLPLGTAPSLPMIEIMGAATDPVLTYRDAGGQSIWRYEFTVTLASTESLLLDGMNGKIWKYASGVRTDAYSLMTFGQMDFPKAFDPHDGNYTLSVWPTLEVTSSTSTRVHYYKRYL